MFMFFKKTKIFDAKSRKTKIVKSESIDHKKSYKSIDCSNDLQIFDDHFGDREKAAKTTYEKVLLEAKRNKYTYKHTFDKEVTSPLVFFTPKHSIKNIQPLKDGDFTKRRVSPLERKKLRLAFRDGSFPPTQWIKAYVQRCKVI